MIRNLLQDRSDSSKMASSLGQDPVSSQEKLAQPPSRLIEGTTSEAKESIHSVRNPEGEQKDPSVASMLPLSMEHVQHNHSQPRSEGEMALSLDIPATTSIDTEGEKPNGILKNKVPRPRNPLIDAVVAHDKSTVMAIFLVFQNIFFRCLNSCITRLL